MDDGKDSLLTLDRQLARHGAAARWCIVKNLGRGKDFSLFVAAFEASTGGSNFDRRADYDGNGKVDFADFAIFKTRWASSGPFY